MQKTVDTEFMKNLGSLQIAGLPPIKELSFSQSEMDDLKVVLCAHSDSILFLHTRTKTILFGGFILGAKFSFLTCPGQEGSGKWSK